MIKRELKASVDIKAPPEAVWRVLLDFPAYPEWSEFLTNIEGPAVPGSRLRIRLASAGGKVYTFKPMVLQVTRARTFRWLGNLGVPGLLDGEHGFFLEYLFGGGTRLRQTEIFGGLLAPLLWRRLEPSTAQGFAAFNRALKRRTESRS
ncbi:MAG: SRPBCC domain-containing protein [Gammaproteobacteria bacterium]